MMSVQRTSKSVFSTFKPNLHYYIFIYFNLFTGYSTYYLQVLPQALEIQQNTQQSVWVPLELPANDLLRYLLNTLHSTFITYNSSFSISTSSLSWLIFLVSTTIILLFIQMFNCGLLCIWREWRRKDFFSFHSTPIHFLFCFFFLSFSNGPPSMQGLPLSIHCVYSWHTVFRISPV